jgi:hypothetical protein
MNDLDVRILLDHLTDRDKAILDDLERFRLLTTRLIQELHFRVRAGGHATMGGATKASMRVLTRLQHHGLIGHLQRRVGGVRHGSQGYIWQLTATGDRLQRTRRGEPGRRRYTEPSPLFTDHTLAIAALATTVRTLAADGKVELIAMQAEPECWRDYLGPHGSPETVKPDLYTITATGEFEDHLFLEADMGSEHLPQIVAKCRAYARYHQTGIEQQKHGVFPAVLWITTTETRATAIRRAITGEQDLPAELFHVITTDGFAGLLTAENTS